jgi:hypothetical protein
MAVLLSTIILGARRKDFLILAFPLYCILYSLVLLSSHTSPTVWSRWIVPLWGVVIISTGYVMDIAAEKFSVRSNTIRFVFPVVAACCLFMLPFMWSRPSNESVPYREVALRLQDSAKAGESIMLEPIGLIGYVSNLYVYDFVGLVSPAVTNARRESGYSDRWYVRYLQLHSPTYVLLRVFELEENQFGYGSGYGDGIFKGTEREWFEQHYASVFVSSRAQQQNAFVVFKRCE